ncbi:MAG: DUF3883 domain-containing protein [Acidobacteria bacterium]|nr:DUF3883 domain-containing protein [Acidobacteriota bacterium]
MKSCIYNTSPHWIEFLRGKGVRDNVNFWRKDTRTLHLQAGAPFYFKELGVQRVVGRGFFREAVNLAAGDAWKRFGLGNGSHSRDDFYQRMQSALDIDAVTDSTTVNCLVLDGLDWLPSPVTLPANFFPRGVLGAKFYEEEAVASVSSAFPPDSQPGAKLDPLILVQNDATIGGDYDYWKDLTGEQYHFSNSYRNRVVPGRRFIYYRGVRRQGGGREQAEYFGHGSIGTVWLDETTATQSRKTDRAWFCSIEDYAEFPAPIAASQQGRYFENITHPRDWQVSVRPITEATYQDILATAGLVQAVLAPQVVPAIVALQPSTNLLRPRRASVRATSNSSSRSFRRSQRATAIGRRAEELVLADLRTQYADVRWLSEARELPGYDIDYEDQGVRHAVEVKGTTGSYFPAIELTINEWRAAKELGERFSLYLVANCEGALPCVQVIRNPASLVAAGQADVSPLLLRFELRQRDE